MKFNITKPFWKSLGRMTGRSIIIYGLVVLLIYSLVNHAERVASRLNSLMPVMAHILEYPQAQNRETLPPIEDYLFYYQKVRDFFWETPDIDMMIAYCYYYNEEVDTAIRYYRRALKIDPDHFWSRYNLGVIYFLRKDYTTAEQEFRQALKLDPKKVVGMMMSSKIFRQIAASAGTSDEKLTDSFEDVRIRAFQAMIICNFHLKNYDTLILQAKYGIDNGYGENTFYSYYLGRVAYEQGQYNRATYYFGKSLQGRNDYPGTRTLMVDAVERMGQGQLAARMRRENRSNDKKEEALDQDVINIYVQVF